MVARGSVLRRAALLGALAASVAAVGCTPGPAADPGQPAIDGGNVVDSPNAAVAPDPGAQIPTAVTPGTPAGNANTPSIAVPRGPATRIVGRADTTTDPNGPMISWPNSQIVVGFTGTQLTVSLLEVDTTTYAHTQAQNNYFDVLIDGVPGARIKLTHAGTRYQVASGLPNAQHTAILIKRTEGQVGRVQFLGASTDGKLTDTPGPSARRIEFIGDSGTAGYGADGNYPCNFTAATENANVTYPQVVGSLLGADVHNIAFSGKGIVNNRDMVDDAEKTLAVLWGWTLPNDESQSDWKPSLWVPQAVLMTLGGNDFYNQILPEATYNAGVIALIRRMQAAYAGVHVFVAVSPMLRDDNFPGDPKFVAKEPGDWTLAGDKRRAAGTKYAKDIVASMADAKVHYLDLPYDDGSRGFGCDMHMSPATHRFEAGIMAPAIQAALGW